MSWHANPIGTLKLNKKKERKKFADNTVAFVGTFYGIITTRPLAHTLFTTGLKIANVFIFSLRW